MLSINCKGQLIDLNSPKVMGILNVTPDSFYDGGQLKNDKDLLLKVESMLNEGATFIDVGGYSSRPKASHISTSEELERVIPIIELIIKHFPKTLISIDTFRSEVAKDGLESGACMVNDISAGNLDNKMFALIAKMQVPYIMMHMPGTPQTMQQNTKYDDVIVDIKHFFSKKKAELNALKINDILIDVGFGFGKTIAQNYTLLQHLSLFQSLGLPILTGVSRKSMLFKTIDTDASSALNATTAANTIALLNGSNILRVHDVKEAMEAVKIVGKVK